MQILRVRWKNFQSYGNRWNEVDMSNSSHSLSLIYGKNGSGKSTVSDVIKFALFGKVGSRKLGDIPNRKNGHCEVAIELQSHGRLVLIERGLKPGYFRVSVDGDDKIGDIAGKLNVQEYLEEEIYGINYQVFSNILSLSINDFQSFIKMAPSAKRAIIDKIFGLSILNRMIDILKYEAKQLKESFNSSIAQLGVLEKTTANNTRELDNLLERIKNNDVSKLSILEDNLRKGLEKASKVNENIKAIREIIDNLETNAREIELTTSKSEHELKDVNTKIKLYSNEKCPVCLGPLDTEFHQSLHEEYLGVKDQLQTSIASGKKLSGEYRSQILEHNNNMKEFQASYKSLDNKIAIIKNTIKEVNQSSLANEQTDSIRKIIEETSQLAIETKVKIGKNEKKTAFLKIIEDVIGEGGIKQMVIRTIIPSLNIHVAKLLKELGLDYKIKFNEEFDATITHLGEEISSNSFSTGEMKKADFAVLIAIIKLLKMKFPGINLLFLDEIFASLDMDAIHHVLHIVKTVSIEIGLNTFIINHAPIDQTVFDRMYSAVKIGNFSNMEIIET